MSNKKYFCNQENINRYTHTDQQRTFLDLPYAELIKMPVPEVLASTGLPELFTHLPVSSQIKLDDKIPILIYNSYNLDPEWRKGEKVNRVLLLEPSHFEKYPISDQVLEFIIALSSNIPGIQVYVEEFDALKGLAGELVYKEHPTFCHYEGTEAARDWIAPEVSGFYKSYFIYYKKVMRSLA